MTQHINPVVYIDRDSPVAYIAPGGFSVPDDSAGLADDSAVDDLNGDGTATTPTEPPTGTTDADKEAAKEADMIAEMERLKAEEKANAAVAGSPNADPMAPAKM